MASKYFKVALTNNFSADHQYGICMTKVDRYFDYLEHLNYMLKFGNDEFHKQKLPTIIVTRLSLSILNFQQKLFDMLKIL